MNERLKDKDFISIAELADILGLSVSYTYNFVKTDECPFKVLVVGKKRIVIPVNSFCKWYESLLE